MSKIQVWASVCKKKALYKITIHLVLDHKIFLQVKISYFFFSVRANV